MPASIFGAVLENDRALHQIAFEMLSLNDNGNGIIGEDLTLGYNHMDDVRSKKSQNMTECVPVPSSEHVAEIVGRQGCKIKALRAKTNTYIKTPVRGEEPVFVVTGRKEDVAKAKKEILSAAEHFSQIRASRKSNLGGILGLTPPGPPLLLPGQVTIQVRVPYRVVGLVVGPKGATIKRIQQQTHTYIVTPSREKDPVFEVTGQPENVELARQEIESHIAVRTGGALSTAANLADLLTTGIMDDNSTEIFNSIYRTGLGSLGSLFSLIDSGSNNSEPLCLLSSTSTANSGVFSSSGSMSSSSSSSLSGGRLADVGSIWSSSSLDEGIGGDCSSFDGIWSVSSTRPSPPASASPTDSLIKQRECTACHERDVNAAFVPCGHNSFCYECASRVRENQETCPLCSNAVTQVIRILSS